VNTKPIAVIPARANSKRIPNKNVKLFGGKPIIVRALETALDSNVFSDVYITTENKEIAEVCRNSGARVPFVRPFELSQDAVRADEVMNHMAKWVNSNLGDVDICCLLPTTPGLITDDFLNSYETWKAIKEQVKTLFAVTEYQPTAFRSFTMNSTKKLNPLFPEKLHFQTQDLEKTYADAGQFYWASTQTWLTTSSITAESSAGFILPQARAIDINELSDWILAEKYLLETL
jgi:pseudaminic acid cytidylyltransferase